MSSGNGADDAPQGRAGSAVQRIRRRVALLESQLGAAKQELEMEREQHELDSQDLVDQNERLRSKASTLQSKVKLAEKRAAAAEQSLALRKSSEAQEADVLETFTAAVEKKLQASEARVGAATSISIAVYGAFMDVAEKIVLSSLAVTAPLRSRTVHPFSE
jgi:predicted  nucleic acid-binding Zn-ribbon protein